MDPATMAILGSAGANILGGVLGGNAAKKGAAQAAAAQKAMYDKNIALLESVGIPSIEAQKIALENPEYVGDMVSEMQGDSGMQDISTDPRLRDNQMNQLAQLQELSQQGLSTVDRIAMDDANQEATSADKSRRAQMLSQMAQRGTADSGAQMIAQLASIESANQQANQASDNIAKNAYSNRIGAMDKLASNSRDMESQDFNRQAQTATAQDAIQRFNAQTRNQTNQYNTGAQQNIANQKASTANTQEMQNKGLIQQDYTNRLNKAQSQAGLNTTQGNNQANNALTKGQGQANMFNAIGGGIGNAASAYGARQAQNPATSGSLQSYNGASGLEDDRDQFNKLK